MSSEASSTEIVRLTEGLYLFMQQVEHALTARRPQNGEVRSLLLERARTLSERFAEARESASDRFAEAREAASERFNTAINDVMASLHKLADELETWRGERHALRDAWAALGRNYEALAKVIRQKRLDLLVGVELGRIKPKNLWRNAFHLSTGLMGITLYELWLTRGQILAVGLALLGTFAALDIGRRVSPRLNQALVRGVFGKISRPEEAHRIPSATWFLLGLVLIVLIYPKHAAELAALTLAVGDPAASLVGKAFGRVKLFRDKSLAGTLTFVLTAGLAGLVLLALVLPGLSFGSMLLVAFGVAAFGALVELFSFGLDDNLTIPIAAGAAAALLLSVI